MYSPLPLRTPLVQFCFYNGDIHSVILDRCRLKIHFYIDAAQRKLATAFGALLAAVVSDIIRPLFVFASNKPRAAMGAFVFIGLYHQSP